MSDTEKRPALMIGGPRDGQWHPVLSQYPGAFLEVLEPRYSPGPATSPFSAPIMQTAIERHIYRVEIFRTGDAKFNLWVHSSIPLEQIMERMVKFYGSPKEGFVAMPREFLHLIRLLLTSVDFKGPTITRLTAWLNKIEGKDI